jgi:hypothetical protein
MMNKNAEEGRLAAKQDLTELLIDILMPPIKSEISQLLEGKIFPFEQGVFKNQENLKIQSAKIAKILSVQFPDNSQKLPEWLQELVDGQLDAAEFSKGIKADLVAVKDDQSKQIIEFQTRFVDLIGSLKSAETSHAATHEQLAHLGGLSEKSLSELGQLSVSAQVQQQTQVETFKAVAELNEAIAAKLTEQFKELITYAQSLQKSGEQRLREGMTILLRQLHAAEAGRAITLAEVQGLAEASHRNLTQLSRQLLSSVDILRLAKSETLSAIETLGRDVQSRQDEHHAELTEQWQSARLRQEERLDTVLGALFESLRTLDKEGIRRVEKLVIVGASQTRADVRAALIEREESLRGLIIEQNRMVQDSHSLHFKALSEIKVSVEEQHVRSETLKSELHVSHKQLKHMFYGLAVMMVTTLGALVYLIMQNH